MGRIRNSAHAICGKQDLSGLYLPQVEQLGIPLVRRGRALVGSRHDDDVEAEVCVHTLEHAVVVTSHRIRIKRDILFHEHGMPGLCLCTLSEDSLSLCPIAQPRCAAPEGNAAIFGQDCIERTYPLRSGSIQNAVSITLLPTWFSRHAPDLCDDAYRLMDSSGEVCPGDSGTVLDALVRAATPLFGPPFQERALPRRVARAALFALAWHAERERAEEAAGTLRQARLVRTAKRHVLRHLDEPLSIDALARDLYVSRSRLCASFTRETGESLGAFITRARMERAALLLDSPLMSVANVARAVGYPRASSFTVAFERAYGCPPSAWPASSRAHRQSEGAYRSFGPSRDIR